MNTNAPQYITLASQKRNNILKKVIIIAVLIFALNIFSIARGAGELSVEIISGPNLVVDSNAGTPASSAPNVASVIGKICNNTGADVTNVNAFIGDYTGPGTGTPGIYPTRSGGEAWIDGGTYSFTHIGGAAGTNNAERLIGTLANGDCVYQYFHFEYPQYDGAGTPMHGGNADPADDYWLDFDIWATADGGLDGSATQRMYFRNEISAMANKIEPNGNPPGVWFNTDTNQIKVGETYTTNGINYDLGNINKGFDNDGDGDYDYNAWLQPFGMNNFDPSCFQLESTEVYFTVNLSGGVGPIVIHTYDQLYFTDEDYIAAAAAQGIPDFDASQVTTASGKVYYTFRILSLPCSAPLTPYQEMASGADNEKFNADYGTAVPGVTAIAPSFELDKDGPLTAAKGSDITYTIYAGNTDSSSSFLGLTSSTNPLIISDSIPAGLEYVAGSASTSASIIPSGTVAVLLRFSTDNGSSWSTVEPQAASVTDIQWVFDDDLAPNTQVSVQFQANTTNYDELTSPTGPVIKNCSEAQLGVGTPFAEACHSTILLGDNSIQGTVWLEDDANGIKEIVANGETYQDNAYISLYYDNGSVSGEYDADDTYVATATTGSPAGDNTYQFLGLPDGDYVVVVDTETNIPVGYRPSSADEIAVNLTDPDGDGSNGSGGMDVLDQDFGFALPFYMNKALISSGDTSEGNQVTYEIILENTLPGSNGSGFCEYTTWATGFGPDQPSLGSNSSFVDPDQALGAPDSAYAVTDLTNSDNFLHFTGFNLGQQAGNITNVQVLMIVDEDTAAMQNRDALIATAQDSTVTDFWTGAIINTLMDGTPGTYQELTPFEYTKSGQDYILSGDGIITNVERGGAGWTWSDFTGNNLYLYVAANKGNINPHPNIRIDAVGLIVTTDSTNCGNPEDTIQILPLEDTYDPTELKFISASPTQSTPTGDPLPNPGTITWNDLGPLAPGETMRVEVTFEILDPGVDPSSGDSTYTNCSIVDGTAAFFADGASLKDGTIQSCTDITVPNTGQIGDLIFADLDLGGDYDPGEPGIPGVIVELWCDGDGNGNFTGNPKDDLIISTATDSSGYYEFEIDSAVAASCSANRYFTVVTPLAVMSNQTYDPDGTLDDVSSSVIILGDDNTANDTDLTRDFGYELSSSSVSGIVWNDADADGVIDSNEPFYSGVSVSLYTDTDSDCTNGYGALASASTNPVTTLADGSYDFTGITTAGYYCVSVNSSGAGLPAQVTDPDRVNDDLYSVNITGGGYYYSYDFGYRPTGIYSIGDRVWVDWDGDGFQDVDPVAGTGKEEGLNGIPVSLYYCDSTSDASCTPDLFWETQTTSGDGGYSFTNLPEGRYQVIVDESQIPSGYTQSGDPDAMFDGQSETISLNAGNTDPDTYDFGYQPIGTFEIGDFVYYDKNNNGIYDTIGPVPDTALSGITVELYHDANNNGQVDNGDALIGTYITASDGTYLFSDLPSDNYLVQAPATTGIYYINNSGTGTPYSVQGSYAVYDVLNICVDGVWTGAAPVGAPAGMLTDSDACDAQYVNNSQLGVANNDYDGSDWYDADFGYISAPAAVGDVIWVDSNQDGLQGSNEPGINGVVVSLFGNLDGTGYTYITQTNTYTESGQEGYYKFENLIPGDYIVVVDDLTGATVNGANVTITAANLVYDPDDSTFDPDTGKVEACSTCDSQSEVTLYPNSNDSGQDFGYRPNASIGDTLWIDSNDDGVIDAAEARLSGVTVQLYNDGTGVLLATTTTDEFGEYAFPIFDNSVSTDYRVVVPDTIGSFTLTYEVKDGLNCNPTQASCDGISVVTVAADGKYLDQDFGYQSLNTTTPGTISGTVFHDNDNNSSLDRNTTVYEPGYQDVNVSLWVVDQNGSWIWYQDIPSDVTGYYEFTNLDAGTYRVYVDTDNTQVDSLVLTTPYYYDVVIPGGGATSTGNDFGFFGDDLVAVGNLVWEDNGAGANFNNNVFDADEAGIDGVTVELYLDDGDGVQEPGGDDILLTSRVTSSGYFIFEGLRESDQYTIGGSTSKYYLHIPATQFQSGGPLEGYTSSSANITTDDMVDQDADENGQTPATSETTDGVSTVMFELQNGGEADNEDSGDVGDGTDTYTTSLPAKLNDNDIDFTKDFAFYQPTADVAIDKTVSPTTASEGEIVTFTIAVTNNGPDAATTIQVQDVIPTAYTYIAASMTYNAYATGATISAPDSTPPTLTWEIDQLDSGETVDLIFQAQYSHKGTVSYTVTNNTGADVTGLDVTVNVPTGFLYIDNSINNVGTPDESAAPTLSWSGITIANGASETFLFDVAYLDSTNVNFEFIVASLTTAGTGSLDISSTINAPFYYAGNILGGTTNDDTGDPTITWSITDPTTVAPATLSFDLAHDATNLAEVIAQDQNDPDSTPNNGVDTDGDGLTADDPGDEDDGDGVAITPVYVDLSLDKTVSVATASAGDTITFTLTVTNNGTQDETNISIVDTVPDGYDTIASVSGGGVVSGSTIIWSGLSIAAGGTTTLTFDANVLATGNYLNIAEVTAQDHVDLDSTPNNGVDTDGDTNYIDDLDDEDDGDGAEITLTPTVASIGDFVWEDLDSDGTFNGAETGLDGITVTLLYDSDSNGTYETTIGSQVTAGGGAYDFTGLVPGVYQVDVITPAGYTLTTANNPLDVTVAAGDDYNDADFGYQPLASIGDFVWEDLDGDGTLNGAETGLDGVTVTLLYDSDSNGTYETTIGSQVTAGGGAYDFTGLVPGDYQVDVTTPVGYALTTANDPLDVTVAAGDDYNDADFGYQPLASIGDFVWEDLDGDGTLNGAETGLDGVTVTLLYDSDSNGTYETTIGSQVTAGGGAYDFTGLVPGDYQVDVTTPAGYALTTANDPLNVTVAAGDDYNDADFGYQLISNPAITVTKSPDVNPVTYNGTVNFTINVTNAGDIPLNTITVTDALCDAAPVYQSGDTNADSKLDLTETWVYSCSTANVTAPFTNSVTATGIDDVNGGTPVEDTYTVDITVSTNPAIAITKSPDVNPVTYNGTVNFTINMTNTGDVALNTVTVSDALCDAAPVYQSGDANADIKLDLTETWVYACSTANVTAPFTNSVTATGIDDVNGGTPVEDTYTVDITVDTTPGIAVTKSPDVNPVTYNGTVNFTINVTNTGDVALNTVTVSDALCDAAPVYQSGDTNADSKLDLTETWVYACSTANVTAPFTNSVTATGIDDVNGGTPVEDTNTVDITVNATAGINIEKTPGTQTIDAGTDATFTLTVTNTGVVNLTNVVITDAYCDTLTGPVGDIGNDGILTPTEIWSYSCVDTNVLSGYTNTARVDAEDPSANPVTDSDTADVILNGNYSIQKSIISTELGLGTGTNGELVTIGELVQYQIVVTLHNGNTTYPGLTIVDTMDEGLAFHSCVNITGNTNGFSAACDVNNSLPDITPALSSPGLATDGRIATYDFGDITTTSSPNNTITITYYAVVLNTTGNQAGTVLDNTAEIGSSGVQDTGDPLEIVEPVLDITKTSNNAYANAGELISFDIAVFHDGNSTSSAYDVIVHDVIPTWLTYDHVDSISGPVPTNINFVGGEVIVTWDEIALGETAVLRLYATIDPTTPYGTTITNVTSAEWTSLPGDWHTTPISPHNELSTERWYDPGDSSDVNDYGGITSADSVIIGTPPENDDTDTLPSTGFTPGQTTTLPQQPNNYEYLSYNNEIRLEIPSLGINKLIVGVPQENETWDTTWLWDQLGYLEGTAFPTWDGNTAITGHVYLSNGLPGPFVNLNQLVWGDKIIIHAYGQDYVYEVRSGQFLYPSATSILSHLEGDWITLLTCAGYDENTGAYQYRYAVQAILVEVRPTDNLDLSMVK